MTYGIPEMCPTCKRPIWNGGHAMNERECSHTDNEECLLYAELASLRTRLAQAEALVASLSASTVGELLEPEHIVEFNFEGDWHQAKRVEYLRHWQVRHWRDTHWSPWRDSDQRARESWHLPAKVVPENQADLDPIERNASKKE